MNGFSHNTILETKAFSGLRRNLAESQWGASLLSQMGRKEVWGSGDWLCVCVWSVCVCVRVCVCGGLCVLGRKCLTRRTTKNTGWGGLLDFKIGRAACRDRV